MAVVTMRQLLESGVHFGHQTRRWNPKMKRFIMTERNGIYIIDLQQSLAYIDNSYAFIKNAVASGGNVLFVGTKKQAQEAVAEQAKRVGMPYVNQRWLGGMLTNFQTVHQRLQRLKELEEINFDDTAGSSRTKKELLQMKREKDKLDRTLGGIRDMGRVPAAVWIVDTNKEHLAVDEARKLGIPIIAILDSNCDPDMVDYPIPGNDDAIRSVTLLTRVIADAVADGLIARAGAKSGAEVAGEELGAEEPLAEWERELLGGDVDRGAVESATAADGSDVPATPESSDAAGDVTPAVEAPDTRTEAETAVVAPAVEAPGAESETDTEAAVVAPAVEAPEAEAEAESESAVVAPAVEAPETEAPGAESETDAEAAVVTSGGEPVPDEEQPATSPAVVTIGGESVPADADASSADGVDTTQA
jgi:small subunit ribosomal protein S2